MYRNRYFSACFIAALSCAACANNNEASGDEPVPQPFFDGPVSENDEFSFTPQPPGAAPGIYVEVDTAQGTFQSSEVEILLREWDGDYRVQRGALTETQPQTRSIFDFPAASLADAGDGLIEAPRARLVLDGATVPDPRDPDASGLRARDLFHDHLARIDQGALAASQKNTVCEPGQRVPGGLYPSIGAIGTNSAWINANFNFTLFGLSETFSWVLHLAREGIYLSLQFTAGLSIPPSDGIAITAGLGVISDSETRSPTRTFSAGTAEGYLISLGVSTPIAPPISRAWAITLYRNSGFTPHYAFQVETGIALNLAGISFFGLSFPNTAQLIPELALFDFLGGLSLSVAVGNTVVTTKQDGVASFALVRGFAGGGCANDPFLTAGNKNSHEGFAELAANLRAWQAESGADFEGALAGVIAESLLPSIDELATNSGTRPLEGIPAATNADWIADLGRNAGEGACTNCADTSVAGAAADTFRRVQQAGDTNEGVLQAAAISALQFRRAMPEPDGFERVSASLNSAVDATFGLAFENAANLRGDPNRYVSREIVPIDVVAGVPAVFTFTAEEIAALVDRPVADVRNATVCIRADFGGPRLEDTCGLLESDIVGGALTIDEVTQLFFYADVDLSTADGDFPDDVSEWDVRPALRLVRTRPDVAAGVRLTAGQDTWSGAPTNLNATVVDANGNLVAEPAVFRFFDGAGTLLGQIESSDGTALWRFVPSPQTPTVAAIEQATIYDQADNEYAAHIVRGELMSGFAQVRINGKSPAELGLEMGPLSSRELYILPMGASALEAAGVERSVIPTGNVTIEVINPGDRSSGPVSIPVQ